MFVRIVRLLFWLCVSWVVMLFTHEMGHIVGGKCCGGELRAFDLWPWHMPYSIFDPDPYPLVTLWSGLLLGAILPIGLSVLIQRDEMWLIGYFSLLANGLYIATAWATGDRYLDTSRMLEHGASPILIGVYCLMTIGGGYRGFRGSLIKMLSPPSPS